MKTIMDESIEIDDISKMAIIENAEMEEKDFELFVHFAKLEVMRVVDPERYHKTAVRIAVAFLNSIDVDYTPIEIAFCRAVVGDSQEPGNQK